MRILGIDPGTWVVGFGCLELGATSRVVAADRLPIAHRVANVVHGASGGFGVGGGGVGAGRVSVVEAGALRLGKRTAPLPDRLLDLAEQIAALLVRLAPNEVALEEAFFGKSVQAALRIGEARGVILAEVRRAGVPVFQFAPARVKRTVTGHGGATKEAVAELARRQLGLAVAPTPKDASDALAVALARVESRRLDANGMACNPSGTHL
jgi:crossover junction endodeoxyribonuclease RuvC